MTDNNLLSGIKEIKYDDKKGNRNRSLFVGYIKDLSTQKAFEQKLQQKVNMCQAMINSSFDPMLQIDEHGIIQMVNNATVSLFGWTRNEMINQNVKMICGGGHAENHDKYLKTYLETGVKKIIGRKRRVPARRKNGSEFTIELGVTETVSDNGEKIFCAFIRDLTQQLLDKQKLHDNDAIMKGKFFGVADGDANSVDGSEVTRGRGRGNRARRRHGPTL